MVDDLYSMDATLISQSGTPQEDTSKISMIPTTTHYGMVSIVGWTTTEHQIKKMTVP
jgi:hypothetical protein